MNCPACQALLAPDSIFCHRCGAQVAFGPPGSSTAPKRPTAITILAVLQFISVPFWLLAMVVLLLGTADQRPFALVPALLGALTLACGIGLWTLRSWGRVLQIVLSVIGLLAIPLGTAVSIMILVYLSKPGVKILFSGKPPEQLTPAEIVQVGKVTRQSVAVVVAVLVLFVGTAALGILAAIAIPLYANVASRARVAKAQVDARAAASAITLYALHCGTLPPPGASSATCPAAAGPGEGPLPTALTLSQTNSQGGVAGPFLASLPTPPVGWQPYRFVIGPAQTFDVCTTGDRTIASATGRTTCP